MIFSLNNKKGMALILVYSLLVIVVGILGVFFYTSIQSMKIAQTRVDFTRAFYAAESGIDVGLEALPAHSSPMPVIPNGMLGNPANAEYSVTVNPFDLSELPRFTRWIINSTGFVPDQASVPRAEIVLEVVAQEITQASPDNFLYAIETEGDLDIKGKAYTIDGDISEGEELDFEALFGITKEEMKSRATYIYDEPVSLGPDDTIEEITWVDVAAGEEVTISGDLAGSGILVVSGDAHIAGTVDFEGIIYIIGALRMSGTPDVNGTILVESGIDIDTTIVGNVTINYDANAVGDALGFLSIIRVISWREIKRSIES
jgi:hypothetical protein